MKILVKLPQFIIHSNIFIAIAAVAMTIQTQIELGLDLQLKPYLSLVFFATLFDYNLHRMNTLLFYPTSLNLPKYKWLKTHLKLFYGLFICSIIGLIISILFIPIKTLIALLPIAIITILYSLPFLPFKGKMMKLRDIPYLKIVIIAFVWASACIIFPYFDSNTVLPFSKIFNLFILKFLFIFLLTIPFDIRDKTLDANNGLKTIAHLFSDSKSVILACILIIVMLIVAGFSYISTGQVYFFLAYLISSLFTAFILLYKPLWKHSLFYHGFVDGAIVLQAVLMLLTQFV